MCSSSLCSLVSRLVGSCTRLLIAFLCMFHATEEMQIHNIKSTWQSRLAESLFTLCCVECLRRKSAICFWG